LQLSFVIFAGEELTVFGFVSEVKKTLRTTHLEVYLNFHWIAMDGMFIGRWKLGNYGIQDGLTK